MQNLVTVFGGSGFVGTQAVRYLAKSGWRIRVAVRNPNLAYKMRLLGDVGQIDVVQASVRDRPSIERALDGAAASLNLVGVLRETGRQGFQAIHVMGARNVAEAARGMGVSRVVQMSAIGADPDGPSKYGRTKAEGEAAVREIFPDAAVVRPSIVFGNVPSGQHPGLAELGITPTSLEAVLPTYLYRYRKGGQYADQDAREMEAGRA